MQRNRELYVKTAQIFPSAAKAMAAAGGGGVGKLIAQAATTAGLAMGAEAIFNLSRKAVQAISGGRKFQQMLAMNPDLHQYDARKVQERFNVLSRFGPTIADDPVVSGHWIKQTMEFPVITPTVLKDVVEVEAKTRQRFYPFSSGPEVGKSIASVAKSWNQDS